MFVIHMYVFQREFEINISNGKDLLNNINTRTSKGHNTSMPAIEKPIEKLLVNHG